MCEVTTSNGNPIFVAVAYRLPHAAFMSDTKFFPRLNGIMHDCSTKVILGGYNADKLSSSEDAKTVRFFMKDNSLASLMS